MILELCKDLGEFVHGVRFNVEIIRDQGQESARRADALGWRC